jgi:hypothetical protein
MSEQLPCRNFVSRFSKERASIISSYFDEAGSTEVGRLVRSLGLNDNELKTVHNALEVAVTDTIVTLLYGLNGSGSIGGDQQFYTIHNENNEKISSDEGGDLESYCSEFFG